VLSQVQSPKKPQNSGRRSPHTQDLFSERLFKLYNLKFFFLLLSVDNWSYIDRNRNFLMGVTSKILEHKL
jgi:hypothetical protein